MGEIHIIGDLNGLGAALLPIMEQNIDNPERMKKISKISGSLMATEKSTGVAITIVFDKGSISIKDGPIKKPSAALWADFDTVAAYSCGDLNPIVGVLKGRIKVRGNILKLLKMATIVRSD
ncbi:MAG: SCP2 sterol-binding domain-containing protein [Desulfomonilia bacterium]